MIYWHKKRHFHLNIWLYSLAAYVIAIALKYAVQLPTINALIGAGDVVLGLYYGLQTVFFEVGLAYLFAHFAVKRGKMDRRDAEAYGSGLGFWENVGLLGILSLINYVAYYAILSNGGSLADTLYTQLSQGAPDLWSTKQPRCPLLWTLRPPNLRCSNAKLATTPLFIKNLICRG